MSPKTRSKNAKLGSNANGEMQVVAAPSSSPQGSGKGVEEGETSPAAGEKRERKEEPTKEPTSKVARTSDKTQDDVAAKDDGSNSSTREAPAKEEKDNGAVKSTPTKSKALQPGKEEGAEDKGQHKILEQGVIYFFYRPKVQPADGNEGEAAAKSLDDVQSAHMLLVPQASLSDAAPAKEGQKDCVGYRLVRLGKKRLPSPEEALKHGLQPGGIGGDSSEAIWAVVSDVGKDIAQLSGSMGEERYNTRTRGERFQPGSRPAGRGRYAVVLLDIEPPSARTVRLVYALSHPTDIGDVQTALGLAALSGSMQLSMRNPTTPQTGAGAPPAGLPKEDRVEMSKGELKEHFGGAVGDGGTRYTIPDDIALLDHDGVELLLTRERRQDGAESGAGEQQVSALKSAAHADGERLNVDDVLQEMHLSLQSNPPDALQGTWI